MTNSGNYKANDKLFAGEDLQAFIADLPPLEEGWTLSAPEVQMSLSLKGAWQAFFADNAPYATFENMEEIGIFKVSKSQWTDEVTLKGDTQFSKPALKYRLVQVKSKLPDIIAAILAWYSYTDLHTYLLDFSPAGFTQLEVGYSSGFLYADRLLVRTKTEVFAPQAGAKMTVLRQLWNFEWLNKPWALASVINDSAKTSISEVNSYQFGKLFPVSLKALAEQHKDMESTAEEKSESIAHEISPEDDQDSYNLPKIESSNEPEFWQEDPSTLIQSVDEFQLIKGPAADTLDNSVSQCCFLFFLFLTVCLCLFLLVGRFKFQTRRQTVPALQCQQQQQVTINQEQQLAKMAQTCDLC